MLSVDHGCVNIAHRYLALLLFLLLLMVIIRTCC
jgi:hypothetical protein